MRKGLKKTYPKKRKLEWCLDETILGNDENKYIKGTKYVRCSTCNRRLIPKAVVRYTENSDIDFLEWKLPKNKEK